MKGLKTLSSVLAVTVLAGCSTVGDRAQWDKESDSVALQITKSAGSFDQFSDRHIPEDALNEVSALGYVGYTGLGMIFSTGVAGFSLALISDNTYGWDLDNYIMFLDASTVPSENEASVEERTEFIARAVSKAMYEARPTLKDVSSVSSFVSPKETFSEFTYDNRVSGFNQGWRVDNPIIEPCVHPSYNGDTAFVGTRLSLYSFSHTIDKSEYSEAMQKLVPYGKTIAVRYMWETSDTCFAQEESKQRHGINANTDTYPSSPTLVLPKNAFVSMPKVVKIGQNKGVTYPSSVRDNENIYYFVKPIGGIDVKSPLADFHKRFVEDPIKAEINE